MLITIRVPDNTAQILYAEISNDNSYIQDPKNVTVGMIIKVEPEDEPIISGIGPEVM